MEFKHLCLVRFKEGVVVDDIIQELTKLAAELDTIKFFGWYASSITPWLCFSFVLGNFYLLHFFRRTLNFKSVSKNMFF